MTMVINTALSAIAVLALVVLAAPATADDNGLARTPPMGWRSWNHFHGNVDQDIIESIMTGMTNRKRKDHTGEYTSLCDLGYCDVGLDDAWQECDAPTAAPGMHFHDESGRPIVNLERFPDMKGMVDYAHDLNLTAGWYVHNCICYDICTTDIECDEQIVGEVDELVQFGFDSLKIDGCAGPYDVNNVKYNRAIKEMSDKPILVENCNGESPGDKPDMTKPPDERCPYNFYRTSRDIHQFYSSIMHNLASLNPYIAKNASYPGCWAYPDMLQVGALADDAEHRSHFGAWAIVSSPLVLGHDVNDDVVTDRIWDIISNREAIAVNQAYVGESGGPYDWSSRMIDVTSEPDNYIKAEVPLHQYYSKKIGEGKIAVLLMNSEDTEASLTAVFHKIPGLNCPTGECQVLVRDIWQHKDLGVFEDEWSVSVQPRDAAFIVVEYVEHSS